MPVDKSVPSGVYPPSVGEGILASWGDSVSDTVVQRFVDANERDAKWSNVPKGAMCVTLDTLTLWVYDGTTWVDQNAGPKHHYRSGINAATPITAWTLMSIQAANLSAGFAPWTSGAGSPPVPETGWYQWSFSITSDRPAGLGVIVRPGFNSANDVGQYGVELPGAGSIPLLSASGIAYIGAGDALNIYVVASSGIIISGLTGSSYQIASMF